MAGKTIDVRGLWFNRLFALRPVARDDPKNQLGQLAWYCLCKCGGSTLVRTGQLRLHQVKSCGCLLVESRSRPNRIKSKRGWNAQSDRDYFTCAVTKEDAQASDTLQQLELREELKEL